MVALEILTIVFPQYVNSSRSDEGQVNRTTLPVGCPKRQWFCKDPYSGVLHF